MGDPLDEATDIGTVISKPQLDKIQRYIALGKGEQGATAHECAALPTDASLSKVRACAVRVVSCVAVCVVRVSCVSGAATQTVVLFVRRDFNKQLAEHLKKQARDK